MAKTTQRYTVQYVSRGQFFATAEGFQVVDIPTAGYSSPCLDINSQACLLDPRAIVQDASGRVVYSPRAHLDAIPSWAQQWLREHPEWDAITSS